MQEPFSLKKSSQAMLNYAKRMLETDPYTHRAKCWDARLVPSIERERERIRIFESGGGMCHLVSEFLWDRNGWARVPVSYLDREGQVICAGHLINILPDGAILDATADQFGEGFGVRRLSPRSVDYGRYRPEFDEDFNPQLYDCVRAFFWNGVVDYRAEEEVCRRRGHGWWLNDTALYVAYLRHQVELGGECYQPYIDALV